MPLPRPIGLFSRRGHPLRNIHTVSCILRGVFLSSFVYLIRATASQILYKIKVEAAQVFFYDFYGPLQINLTFFKNNFGCKIKNAPTRQSAVHVSYEHFTLFSVSLTSPTSIQLEYQLLCYQLEFQLCQNCNIALNPVGIPAALLSVGIPAVSIKQFISSVALFLCPSLFVVDFL